MKLPTKKNASLGKRRRCPTCGALLQPKGPTLDLTTRQREVIRLIAKGMTAQQIGNELNISSRTAEFHRMMLMERLGLRTTAELTRYAIAHELVESA